MQLQGEISGSVILYGNSLIAATVEGNVSAINISNPMGAHIWDRRGDNILEGFSTEMVSSIRGSPALVKVYNQNSGKVESLVLVSTDRGLVGLSADSGKPLGYFWAENLRAGPSIGLVSNSWAHWLATRFHSPRFIAKMFWRSPKIAVVPQNLTVLGVKIEIPFSSAWTYPCSGCPAGFQFTEEASINGHDVFLSASTALVGLDLTSGFDKWAPINLNDSAAKRPATTNQGTNGYVCRCG